MLKHPPERALEMSEGNFEELYPVLGTTSIMFSNTGNSCKTYWEFRRQLINLSLRRLRSGISFIGDQMLDALVAVKTREELIGDIILLLQSPARNVVSALQSGGNKIHGVLETLSKKEE